MSTEKQSIHSIHTKVVNRRGLHARAAVKIASVADHYKAEITIFANGAKATAGSIMNLMLLAAGPGDQLKLDAFGDDAEAALDEMRDLIETGFGEDCEGIIER